MAARVQFHEDNTISFTLPVLGIPVRHVPPQVVTRAMLKRFSPGERLRVKRLAHVRAQNRPPEAVG